MPEQTLAQRVRAKYPGAYDDLDDQQLEAAIIAKYPGQYDDLPRTPPKGDKTYESMTPDERRAAWSRGEAPIQRTGLPEFAEAHPIATTAAFVAAAAGPGIVRGAMQAGAPMAARAANVAKATATAVAPQAKYEIVRTTLTAAGVPPQYAIPVAMVLSGLRRGASKPDVAGGMSEAGRVATETSAGDEAIARLNRIIDEAKAQPVNVRLVKSEPMPSAAAPAAPPPAPAAAPAPVDQVRPQSPQTYTEAPAQTPSPLTSPQIADQLGLASARAKVNLTAAQHRTAFRMVRYEGATPAEAVQKVSGVAVPPPEAPVPASSPTPPPDIAPSELAVWTRLIKQGKTPEQAAKAILDLRALRGQLGTPSVEAVEARVAERNRTGRWSGEPQPSPQNTPVKPTSQSGLSVGDTVRAIGGKETYTVSHIDQRGVHVKKLSGAAVGSVLLAQPERLEKVR